jgi:hypothetical protein
VVPLSSVRVTVVKLIGGRPLLLFDDANEIRLPVDNGRASGDADGLETG